MATKVLKKTVTSYGSGGNWTNEVNRNVQDNDNGRFYIGGETSRYRARIAFTIDKDLIVTEVNKLYVAICDDNDKNNGPGAFPKSTRGFLTDKNYTSSDFSSGYADPKNFIEASFLYKDTNRTERLPSSGVWPATNTGNGYRSAPMYLVFDNDATKTKLEAGKTYYIYLLPYDSDKDDYSSPKFSSVWIRSRNWDKWLTVTLDYTSKTACGAPTTVSATKKMKKGGSSTISWSGATDGVANAIAEYRVYYKIGSAPTTSDKYAKAASGATSVSISNKTIGAKKGQTVYFKV
jgi:hypothetical protein